MFDHEYFCELSAIAATRQLTAEETAELAKHLLDCKECSLVNEEYLHLVRHQLPQAHAVRYVDRPLPLELPPSAEIRDRFLGRLRAEGACFTPNAERPTQPLRSSVSMKWQVSLWRPLAASAALAAVLVLGIWLSRNHGLNTQSASPVTASIDRTNENTDGALSDELESFRHKMELTSRELDRLRREKLASDDSLHQSQMKARQAQDLADKLLAENQAEKAKNAILSEGVGQRDGLIASLRAQNDAVNRQRADDLSNLILERQRSRKLSESLDLATMDAERQQQLGSITDDIRRLMGARNLHIVDVRDMNLDRRTAKAFGRVFYAEGQSLIFYAFDLPNSGATPAKYTFQAWGGQDSSSKSPRNLGTFEVDDTKQQRWVLKVNDPSLLAGIDTVFVTAESIRDIKEPRGKKLLYAYLGGQPNHP